MTTTPLAIVTGAPGWLGTRLVRTLATGLPDVPRFARPSERRIRCLVLPGADASALQAIAEQCKGTATNVELVEGDLTRSETLPPLFADADGATLFHSAGVIHPSRGVKQMVAVNAGGTQNLVDAAAAAGVRRMIHVSSNSPFGTNKQPEDLFDEQSPFHPYMGYGRTKMRAEQIVKQAGDDGRLETVIIRPPWFYGPDQPPRQTLFFQMIKNGKVPVVGGGENRRSMAYVDNICQGLMLCEVVDDAAGEAFWIADEQPYTYNQIVGTVEQLLERDFGLQVAHKRMRLPGFFGGMAWLVDKTLQSLGLYHQKIHVLSELNKNISCSVDKAKRVLGYKPKIALEEGMRRSIQWLLDQGISI